MRTSLGMMCALSLLAVSQAGSAEAATCNAFWGAKEIEFSLTQGDPDAVLAVACISNALDTDVTEAYSIFGATGWKLAARSNSSAGDGTLSIDGSQSANASGLSPWSSASASGGFSRAVVALNQGNAFAAFEVDPDEDLSGLWSTSEQSYRDCDNPDFSAAGVLDATDANACLYNDLTHASVFYQPDGSATTAVPLPASGVLLLAGLGGLALRRRRRQTAG